MNPIVGFMQLFPEFLSPSWNGWRRHLAKLHDGVREFYAIVGRGAGKSRIVALIACCFAVREYKRQPGENIFIGVFAPDRKQAGVTFRYIVGLLKSVESLAQLIVRETAESIELANGVIVEVLTASVAAPRGRAYALVIVEEAAFLPTDQDANPDMELIRAVRPALARVPGSLLCVVSSPYAKRGVLWNAFQKYHGKIDSDVVYVKAPTLDLNPTFDRRAIEKAQEEDPASARSEYGAEFRDDIETFISPEVVQACVVEGRHELLRANEVDYLGFVDLSGGSGSDSSTLSIGHRGILDGHPIAIVDAIREVRPPLSPEAVVADFAALLRGYGIPSVTGDRYAGAFPADAFRRHGIDYVVADRSKSDLYRDALPLLNSGHIELLDNPRLINQLTGLERRTARGGRDSIDHAPGQHDDVANVVCGLAVQLAAEPASTWVSWGEEKPISDERARLRDQLIMMRRYQDGDYPHW